jgi:hypothetical protein
MERLRNAVRHVKDGEWLCRAPVVLTWSNRQSLALAPGVVYRAGVRYQGVDVGALLDDWLATNTSGYGDTPTSSASARQLRLATQDL